MEELKRKYDRIKELYENQINITDSYRRIIRGQNASIRKLNKKVKDFKEQLKNQDSECQ